MKSNPGAYTGQILLGDLAYEIVDNIGLRGEWFFNGIQNFSASWPLIVTDGNLLIF
jgi:hypothetical protein